MATKKQQRRREKLNRHEYVYQDDEGNEYSVPPRPEKKDAAAKPVAGAKGRSARNVPPPTWKRAGKWSGGFTAVMIVLAFTTSKGNIAAGILVAVLYGVALTPGFYWMHRFQYRAAQRLKERSAAKR